MPLHFWRVYIIISPRCSNKSGRGGLGETLKCLEAGRSIPLPGDTCFVETTGLLFSWMHVCSKNDCAPFDGSVLTAHLLLKALHTTQLCVGRCLTTGSLGKMRGRERKSWCVAFANVPGFPPQPVSSCPRKECCWTQFGRDVHSRSQ